MWVPKNLGGLGFKDIQMFNQALLAKQAWRLLQVPNCLFSIFIKSRYYSSGSFLNASGGDRPFFASRSIAHGRELLKLGLRQMVENGSSLRVWTSPWIGEDRMRAPLMKNILVDLELRVKNLINQSTKTWDRPLLDDLFYPTDVDLIMKFKPVISSYDFLCWQHNKSGEYSVKSGYWLACQLFRKYILRDAAMQPSLSCLKEQIWSLHTVSKV